MVLIFSKLYRTTPDYCLYCQIRPATLTKPQLQKTKLRDLCNIQASRYLFICNNLPAHGENMQHETNFFLKYTNPQI